MDTIIAISGSLRAGSYNTALARAATTFAPAGCRIELAPIRDIPLYDGDVEAKGMPAAVVALKDQIASSRGLLIVTPEYNNSIPGVLKNAIDWLTRPGKDIPRVFGGLPIGLMGATPGMGGTRLAQTAWLPVLRQLGCRPFFDKSLYVSGAGQVFDGAGNLVDDKIRTLLAAYVESFSALALSTRRTG